MLPSGLAMNPSRLVAMKTDALALKGYISVVHNVEVQGRSAALSRSVPCNDGCTPSMGMNLWGGSPLSEDSALTVLLTSITTSRRQGQCCEVLSKGSLSAKRRADEQKLDTRLNRRVEWAPDHEDHEFARYSKAGGCVVTVHVLI